MSPLPKESELLILWRLERELDDAKEIGAVDRAFDIEMEIEAILNALSIDRPEGRRERGD